MSDPIASALGIPAMTTANNTSVVAQPANAANTDIDNDYTFARTNLYDMLVKGSSALEELVEIAKQSQHPRSFEALALLIKNLGDVNDKLLNLQKNKRELEDQFENDESNGPIHVANAIFVGTTNDLLDLRKAALKIEKD